MSLSDTSPESPISGSGQPGHAVTAEPDPHDAVPKSDLIRFGVGFSLLGVLWIGGLAIVAWAVLPQRLSDIGIENPAAVLGTVNAFGTVFALVSNIVWGVMSDRTRTRIGRRTPWIIAGTLLAGFFLWSTGASDQPAVVVAAFCAFQVCLNMLLAPATAVLSDRVPQSSRGIVSACYGTGITIGTQIGMLIGASFLTNTSTGFIVGASIVAISGILAVVVWPKEPSNKGVPVSGDGVKGVILSLRPPKNAPDFWWAFGSRFFMLIAYQMIFTYQVYIIQQHIGQTVEESAATMSTMAIITLVVSLIGAVISGPVSDFMNTRKIPIILAAFLFAVGIAMPWIFPTTTGMFLYAGLAGFGYGVYLSVDQALLVDVLPNKEEAGKDLSILNMSTTAGATLGPIITSVIVTVTGSYAIAFPVAMASAVFGALAIFRIKHIR